MSLGLKILSTNLKTWRKYCKENLQKDEMEIESGIEEQKNLKEQVSGSEKKKIGKWRVAPAFNKDIVKQFKEYSPREPEFMKDGYEIGIDEAGRGPVMGPMVYAGLIWPVKLKKKLAAIGFTDSKKLDTEEKREMFFEAIEELRESVVEYKFVSLSSRLISNTTLDKSTAENLNTISFNSAFAIIQSFLDEGIKITHAYIDTVGKPEKYKEKLEQRFGLQDPKIEFTVESKADNNYPVTGAASVVAKVQRDRALHRYQFVETIGLDDRVFGCGYTSDEYTKKWLKNNWNSVFGLPEIIRFNWSTVSKDLYEKMHFKLNVEAPQFCAISDIIPGKPDLLDMNRKLRIGESLHNINYCNNYEIQSTMFYS